MITITSKELKIFPYIPHHTTEAGLQTIIKYLHFTQSSYDRKRFWNLPRDTK